MCEINPKREKYFRIEVFTSQEISNDKWNDLVIAVSTRLVELEIELNQTGEIRVHVHDDYRTRFARGMNVDDHTPSCAIRTSRDGWDADCTCQENLK